MSFSQSRADRKSSCDACPAKVIVSGSARGPPENVVGSIELDVGSCRREICLKNGNIPKMWSVFVVL